MKHSIHLHILGVQLAHKMTTINRTKITYIVIASVLASGMTFMSGTQAFASAFLDLTGDCNQPTKTTTYGGGGPCGFVGKGDVQNAYSPL